MPGLLFATPWLLAALAALPALWLLLRLVPPPPRSVRLPTLTLLGVRDQTPPPAGRPPWWLTALRLGAVSLLILGLAGPTLKPDTSVAPPARLTLVIDNGWIAGAAWPRIEAAALERLDALRLSGTRVAVVTTAPPPGGWPAGGPRPPRFTDVATARATVQALKPWPWATDRAAAARAIPADGATVWISDGQATPGDAAFRTALRGAEVAVIEPATAALAMAGPSRDGWIGQIVRSPGAPDRIALAARDSRGLLLGREDLAVDDALVPARLPLDPAASARVARIEAEPGGHAGAVHLATAADDHPRVALVDGARQDEAPPLASAAFYVRRALEPHSTLVRITAAAAVRDPAALVILVDAPVAPGPLADALRRKAEGGAVIVSFAGPRIAEGGTALAPAPLRRGARALGGVLSWQKPLVIGGTAPDGPLAGLALPPEATVARQILAQGEAPGTMRWAWLSDGTPLVTARRVGAGLLVLVHTAPEPGWSALPLTGTLETMLRRLLPLARDPQALDIGATRPFVLESMLGADGTFTEPPIRAVIPAVDWPRAVAGAATPPGLYRSGDTVRPLDLQLGPTFRFVPARTAGLRVSTPGDAPVDLGGPLILAAVLLFAIDALVALALRGALPAAAALAVAWMAPSPAEAAQAVVQLAYVRTGDATIDRTSADGLAGLGDVLRTRTAVAPGPPAGVDPARDGLGRYPVLYWPVTARQRLGPDAAARLRDYLDRGGLILFDLPMSGDPAAARTLLAPLGLPPLAELSAKHVLARSFYLLRTPPPGTWVEAGTDGSSGRVSGVVLARGGWAAKWRRDSAVAWPEREAAWRFGVNVVLYALTGTYKADGVHTRNLLDRMADDPPR